MLSLTTVILQGLGRKEDEFYFLAYFKGDCVVVSGSTQSK